MAVIVEDGQLTLTGYVGESTLEIDGWVIFDGFTHAEVVAALGEIGPDVDLTVHINSGGGIATEGTAIRSALADRDGRTDVVIDGIAASAASLIAMAGDTVRMSLGSLLMIHDPSGFTWGTVEDHEKTIKGLNSLGSTYARVYARKSGKADADCRDIMRAETWYTPDEAVAAGFADETIDDQAAQVAAFPYQHYARAPGELVATARNQGWRPPVPVAATVRPSGATPPGPPNTAEETQAMADDPNPAPPPDPATAPEATPGAAEVKARIKAITEAGAAQGHEALARHLAFDTDMPAEAAIATLQAAASDRPDPEDSPPDPAGYQASRTAASALAQPVPGTPKPARATIDTSGIYAARRSGTEG